MSNLRKQLIRLGNKKPSLRKHIKPVLRRTERRTSSRSRRSRRRSRRGTSSWYRSGSQRKRANAFDNAIDQALEFVSRGDSKRAAAREAVSGMGLVPSDAATAAAFVKKVPSYKSFLSDAADPAAEAVYNQLDRGNYDAAIAGIAFQVAIAYVESQL